VLYTIDEHGNRVQPSPSVNPVRGDIVFLGCSYTFGVGVNDGDNYPYLVAKNWPAYRVWNIAVSGWGTSNVVVALEDHLRRHPPPKLVSYGFIDHHIKRNSLRKSVRSMIGRLPHFEIADGKLVYHGIQPSSIAVLSDHAETDRLEIELTVALLGRLDEICRERKIPFAIISLDRTSLLADFFSTTKVIDLAVLASSDSLHPKEGHPTAAFHRRAAEEILSDRRFADAVGDADLYRPGRIPIRKVWSVASDRDHGEEVHLEERDDILSLVVDRAGANVQFKPELILDASLRGGQVHRVSLDVRSSGPHFVSQRADWQTHGEHQQTNSHSSNVDREWVTTSWEFTPPADVRTGRILISALGPTPGLEIRHFTLTCEGENLLPYGTRVASR
jgi:hypothetical protein